MTDKDIIKALGCCADKFTCDQCPYNDGKCRKMYKDAIDLIICQKAEIDRLRNSGMCASSVEDWQAHCRKIRAEAIKEFAQRLRIYGHDILPEPGSPKTDTRVIFSSDLERIIKEMTEEQS